MAKACTKKYEWKGCFSMIEYIYMHKKHIIILGLLFLIAFFLRFISLASIPGGFHEDEAHIGYNAYSLLKTAKDKNNVFLPLAIDQFGDFRPSGLHFLTVPSVALFGLTEFATRLPVAVVGSLSVIVIYFLSFALWKKESVALTTAGILAINPWSIIASRSTSESVVAMFFVMIGAIFSIYALREKNKKVQYIICSVIMYGLSFFFYHAARYFVPFFLLYISGLFYFDKQITKKTKIIFGISSILLIAFLGSLFLFSGGSGRPQEISIFSTPATRITLWQQASEDIGQNVWFTRFYHNVITDYSYVAFKNYFAHFSPDFLFFVGGLPPRYQAPWSGNFYLLDGLFLLIGVSILLSDFLNRKKQDALFFLVPLVWLLLGPIPAAFTFEDIPHFQRAIMMLPGFVLIAGFGVVILVTAFRSKIIRIGLVTVLGAFYLYSFLLFSHDYYHHSLVYQPWFRNEGQRDLVMAVDSYTKQNVHVIMTTQNANRLIFYLFYNKVDPAYYQKIGSPRDHNGLQFQNTIMSDSPCPSHDVENYNYKFPVVFVDVGSCVLQKNTTLLQTIKRKDTTPVFMIVKR